jgi:hypothetical protein
MYMKFCDVVFLSHREVVTTRQAMHVECNIKAPCCNHCCNGKAISITYSEGVFAALGIQHTKRMRHVVICGLPGSKILPHKRHDFGKNKIIAHKMCFDFLYTFCLKHSSLSHELSELRSQMCIGLHVQCLLVLSGFNGT